MLRQLTKKQKRDLQWKKVPINLIAPANEV